MLGHGLAGLFLGIFIGGSLGVAGLGGAVNGALVFGPIGFIIGVLAAPRGESLNSALKAIGKAFVGLLQLVLVIIFIWAIALWWYYQPESRCGSTYQEFAKKEGIKLPSSIDRLNLFPNEKKGLRITSSESLSLEDAKQKRIIVGKYNHCLEKHTWRLSIW